ncbi:hypothetical protein [Alkalicoccus luteus]|uniref:Uncharacterized protein n=1 Tax=Alkalicoccus luteus TaxID=1237094 RepID=A0A969PSC9_9BACI|nr:hypothetical protein [Alkalicoccus luteus]NJP38189.1 hypothetical protein [Alkalicoccus luteus]
MNDLPDSGLQEKNHPEQEGFFLLLFKPATEEHRSDRESIEIEHAGKKR